MTETEEQIAAGKKIVYEILRNLAGELNEPWLAEVSLEERDKKNSYYFLLRNPRTRQVFWRLNRDVFADLPARPGKKNEVKRLIRDAVIASLRRQ